MAESVEISVLCVEDESIWREQVKEATNSRDGITVDSPRHMATRRGCSLIETTTWSH